MLYSGMGRTADTHIRVTSDTWKELNQRKEPGESFDDVLQRLIAESEERSQNEGNRSRTPAATAD
jgi:predicted CopG family antitoxin